MRFGEIIVVMTNRRVIGPIATIAAVGIVGSGWWLVNTAQNPNPPAEAVQAEVSPAAAAPPAEPPAAAAPPAGPPAPEGFPQHGDYLAEIPLKSSVLVVEMTVDGQYAKAYACDNVGIETWLSGPATYGGIALADKTGSDRLDGQLRDGAIVGTLWVGERSWEFEATRVGADGGY